MCFCLLSSWHMWALRFTVPCKRVYAPWMFILLKTLQTNYDALNIFISIQNFFVNWSHPMFIIYKNELSSPITCTTFWGYVSTIYAYIDWIYFLVCSSLQLQLSQIRWVASVEIRFQVTLIHLWSVLKMYLIFVFPCQMKWWRWCLQICCWKGTKI